MKKALIVTASTGAGHNSVARSLRDALNYVGEGAVEVYIIDLLAQNSSFIGQTSRLYSPIIVHYPYLWRLIYNLSDSNIFCRLFRTLVTKTWGNLVLYLLKAEAPDCILCVHPLCNQIIAQGLLKTKSPVPLITVITDLGDAHYTWIAPEVSLYIAPTAETHSSLLAKGVDCQRLALLGLPVGRRFFRDATDRCQIRQKAALNKGKLSILLTGGGEGAGAILAAAKAISEARLPVSLTIACGRNENLCRELAGYRLTIPHQVMGFKEDMSQVIKTVDIVIGKAGALTIGEAIAARVPIIILKPLPGQERGNVEFVRRYGMGVAVSSLPCLVKLLETWIANPNEIEEVAAKGDNYRLKWSQAANKVAATVLNVEGEQREVAELVIKNGRMAQ